MSVAKQTTTVRVPRVMRLNDEMVDEVARMMAIAGVSKPWDLYNNALTFLGWALEQKSKGLEIAAYEPEKKRFTIITMPILEAGRRTR